MLEFYVDVCIVGGGVSGIAAAIAVQYIGLTCVVFEKDEKFEDRKQGYGLTLTKNNNGPLAKLGILCECVSKDSKSESHYVFDWKGYVHGYYGRAFESVQSAISEQTDNISDNKLSYNLLKSNIIQSNDNPTTQGGNIGNLRIPRQDLRQMLLDKLLHKDDVMQWGWKCIDYTEKGTHVDVCLNSSVDVGKVTSVRCAILIGADGIRSNVRKLRDEKENLTHLSPLQYLGVSVIIGLSEFSKDDDDDVCHNGTSSIYKSMKSLSAGRGFYVVDGTHRMFTMPYRETQNKSIIMWQLSFSGLSEDESNALRKYANTQLLNEALKRTETWFPEVKEMLLRTNITEIWGTGIYDRDPMPLKPKWKGSRVTVIGDACHPMSMFKGQGANQALEDAPLLAKWLKPLVSEVQLPSGTVQELKRIRKNLGPHPLRTLMNCNQTSLFTRLRCFEREMVSRATSKLKASRESAHLYHSSIVFDMTFEFEGIQPEIVKDGSFVQQLKSANVKAGNGCIELLDDQIKRVLHDNRTQ